MELVQMGWTSFPAVAWQDTRAVSARLTLVSVSPVHARTVDLATTEQELLLAHTIAHALGASTESSASTTLTNALVLMCARMAPSAQTLQTTQWWHPLCIIAPVHQAGLASTARLTLTTAPLGHACTVHVLITSASTAVRAHLDGLEQTARTT
jgi:hypothetical protein